MTTAARMLAGASILGLASAPPLSAMFEASMLTHMLLQIPALFVGGYLLASGMPRSPALGRWNLMGVPGLLAALLIWAYWMTPIALDRAVANARWDAIKVVSVALSGVLVFRSWLLAAPVMQGFFVGNLVWMTLAFGLLFQDSPTRFCLAYLGDDQSKAGTGLVALGIVAAIGWVASLPSTLAGDAVAIDSPADHLPEGRQLNESVAVRHSDR